ncbi:MAG: outer membrane protein assembly factor BamB family protein [Planctomycetota bacterium]|jgi:outer membrane protein assembly factor BamB
MKKLLGLLAGVAALHGSVRAREPWPRFRGPRGDGSVRAAGLPLEWSETENVRWKTAIPHLGWSSPVVQDDQVWLTSATKKGNDFYAFCVDAKSGRIVFEKHLFHCDKPEPLNNGVNCYASPPPAVEPGRAYVHFGSYGTACLDTATGEVVWKRSDLPCRHYRGPGSSVILYQDTLILTMDGVDVQYLAALDKRTGRTVWKTVRDIKWNDLDANGKPKREGDFRKGYTTPIVIDVGGREQLVSPASTAVIAYEPRTGKEIWRVRAAGYGPAVSPVFGSGLVWTATGFGSTKLLAIRPDGTGDVTDSHLAWRDEGRDVPTTPSPAEIDGLLYVMSNKGMLNCFEAASGKVVYRERIGGNHLASPIHDGRRIYYSNTIGRTTVIRAGRRFEKLAENKLDSGFMASPAVLGDSLILRTKTHLYRIGGE